MRYVFVSDLHANLQAWQTVLADITAMDVDKIICLGDVVGYGPRPAEVLASAYANVDHFVLGNHDAVIGDFMPADCFNEDAQRMIAWTRSKLDRKAVKFFQDVPLAITGAGFRGVHGSPDKPDEFGYIMDEADARQAWACFSEEVLFVGHTHDARLHYLNLEGKYRCVEPVDFEIETGKRYIVNVGSVGMPRDEDFRSSYVIYDSDEPSVSFRRLPYDVESFRRDVRARIGESRQADCVLAAFDEQRRTPVREQLDFAPGSTRLRMPAVQEQQIDVLKTRASRWRLSAAALLLICLAVTAVAWTRLRNRPQLLEEIGAPGGEISLAGRAPNTSLSLLPNAVYTRNQPPRGWSYRLHDANAQTVEIAPEQGLVLESENAEADIEIALPPIRLAGRRKAQILITGPTAEKLDGELPVLYFDEVYEDGQTKENAASKPAVILRDGTIRIQRTTRRLPKSMRSLQLRLRCRFQGRLQFNQCVVIPKE